MDDLTKTIATTVSSAIEAQAKAQFLTALGGTDALVDQFIKFAAKSKVKRDYREVPLLDAVIDDTVKKLVEELVVEMLRDERDRVKAELAKRFRSDAKTLAERLVDHYIPAGRHIYVEVRKDG